MPTLPRRISNHVVRPFFWLEKQAYAKGILGKSGLTLPDFMGIGAEKAGTTWLWENLRSHAGLYLPERKELAYFNKTYRVFGMSLRRYSQYFQGEAHQVQGEVTPCLNLPQERIQLIHELQPQLKLLVLLRNPVERFWSAANMRLAKAQGRLPEEVPHDEYLAMLAYPDVADRGCYARQLARWRSAFTPEQLWVGFYEDILSRPQVLLEEVFAFLAVDQPTDWTSFPWQEQVNVSTPSIIPPEIARAAAQFYLPDLRKLALEFPNQVALWIEGLEGYLKE